MKASYKVSRKTVRKKLSTGKARFCPLTVMNYVAGPGFGASPFFVRDVSGIVCGSAIKCR